MRQSYYKPSGAVGREVLWSYPLIGGLGAALSAILYALASHYIPFVYLKVLLTIGFGFGVGISAAGAAKAGKVRSTGLNIALATGVLLFALYLYWVFWLLILTEWQRIVLDPDDLFLVAGRLAEEGLWSFSGTTPKGIGLYAIWAAEAAIVGLIGILVSHNTLKEFAFCERCGRWADEDLVAKPLQPLSNPGEFRTSLESSPAEAVRPLLRAASENVDHTILTVKHCTQCGQFSTLSVVVVGVKLDSKGKTEKKSADLVDRMLLDAADYGRIREIISGWTTPSVAEPAAAAPPQG